MAKKSIRVKSAKSPEKASDQSDLPQDTTREIAGIGANLIVTEIILRAVSRLSRQSLEKAAARRHFGPAKAKAIVEERSILHTVAAYGVTKLATRSVPGALLVGGGLLAKTLYHRGSAKRKARKQLKELPGPKSEK